MERLAVDSPEIKGSPTEGEMSFETGSDPKSRDRGVDGARLLGLEGRGG